MKAKKTSMQVLKYKQLREEFLEAQMEKSTKPTPKGTGN
jgi:hypothetical protein